MYLMHSSILDGRLRYLPEIVAYYQLGIVVCYQLEILIYPGQKSWRTSCSGLAKRGLTQESRSFAPRARAAVSENEL